MYDITAGEVMTPNGPAKYVSYDSARGMVVVEHDYMHLVEYDAKEVFVDA